MPTGQNAEAVDWSIELNKYYTTIRPGNNVPFLFLHLLYILGIAKRMQVLQPRGSIRIFWNPEIWAANNLGHKFVWNRQNAEPYMERYSFYKKMAELMGRNFVVKSGHAL
jgi:hypothetical protein